MANENPDIEAFGDPRGILDQAVMTNVLGLTDAPAIHPSGLVNIQRGGPISTTNVYGYTGNFPIQQAPMGTSDAYVVPNIPLTNIPIRQFEPLQRQRELVDKLFASGVMSAPGGYSSPVDVHAAGQLPGTEMSSDTFGYQAGLKGALAKQMNPWTGIPAYLLKQARDVQPENVTDAQWELIKEAKESNVRRALEGYRTGQGGGYRGAALRIMPEPSYVEPNVDFAQLVSHTDSGVGGDEIPTTVDVMPVISPPTDFRSNMPVIGPYAEPADVDLTVEDILREQYNPRFVDAQELIPEITPKVFDDFVTEAILGIDKPSEVEDFSAIQERADQERAERERAQVRADNQRRENEAREAQDRARQDREKQERQARERKQEAKDRENRIREESRKAKEAQLQADDRKAIARARADAERAEREAEKARAKERQATIQRQEDVRRRQASERAAKQAEQARKAAIAAAKPTPVRRRRGGAPASRRVWTQPSRGRGR